MQDVKADIIAAFESGGTVVIDAFAFCRNGEHLNGTFQLSKLSRLRAESASGEGEISWTLDGEISRQAGNHPMLHLTVSGTVQLKCQRCLEPFPFQINAETTIILAKNEEMADQLDALLQDNEYEIIVGGSEFDVTTLIEDEVLLALPISPKHDDCPTKMKLNKNEREKESPFAILKERFVDKKTKN